MIVKVQSLFDYALMKEKQSKLPKRIVFYLDFPRTKLRQHKPTCPYIQLHGKQNRTFVTVNNISDVVRKIRNREYRPDQWLDIDPEFSDELASIIRKVAKKRGFKYDKCGHCIG